MKNISIRVANSNDAAELSRLNQAFNGGEPQPAVYIEAALARGSEIVAVAEGQRGGLCGFACAQVFWSFCYTAPQGEITEMYVEPAYRRKGIARALLTFLEEQLKSRGVHEVKMLTGQRNEIAQHAYQASAYELDDAVVLTKTLASSASVAAAQQPQTIDP